MWELKFAKEPFDSKLFILCFLKKFWMVPVAMVIGMVLVGGGNYLTKVVFGGPAQYEITSSYYVDYYMDPQTGAFHNYVNEATWETIISMDWFTDRIWEHALEQGMDPQQYTVEKEDLAGFLSADLLTDVHIPYSKVVTESRELTEILNKAAQLTFMDFGEQQPEILGVRLLDETPLQEKDRDDRTFRACVLGAVLGGFVACVGICLWLLSEDSVLLPETFSYRYGVPMLGAICKGEKELSEQTLVNLQYTFRNGKNVAVCSTKPQVEMPEGNWPKDFYEVKENGLEAFYDKLRQADGVLLLVRAGARNGKEIEHCLHEMKIQDIKVQGALLVDADEKLFKAYYMGRKQKQDSI